MSSLVLGNIFEIATRASRLAYDVGVAGQSVTGALDQLVTAVSGEIFVSFCSTWGAGSCASGVAEVNGASHGSVAAVGSVLR